MSKVLYLVVQFHHCTLHYLLFFNHTGELLCTVCVMIIINWYYDRELSTGVLQYSIDRYMAVVRVQRDCYSSKIVLSNPTISTMNILLLELSLCNLARSAPVCLYCLYLIS